MTIRPWRLLRHLAALVVVISAVVSPDLSSQGQRGRGLVLVDGREAVEGEVLVRFRNPDGMFEQRRVADDVEADQVEALGLRGSIRLRARRMRTTELLARLRANPDVEFAEPNYIIRLEALPNDPSFGNLWGLLNSGQNYGGAGSAGADVDAALAWDLTTGTRNNVVGIVDSGIDYTHPDLAANIWTAPTAFSVTIGGVVINCAAGTHGFNAITNTCNPMDDNNHGTHIAGTIGAVGNNGVGVAGVNWTASMMGLKFLDSTGSGTTANAIKAIEFAVQAKAVLGTTVANVRVLSNSWVGSGFSQSLLNEINRTNSADMLFVAAAGNATLNLDAAPMFPASYSAPNIIAVAATDNLDQRASFSNYGAATVHLGAPGVAILSTTVNNTYAAFSGTSMAAPHVSGAAALLLAVCSLNTEGLKTALLTAVDPIAAMAGVTTTGGRLNVNNAIRVCQPISVRVPNVVGLTQAAATTSVSTAGLVVGTVSTAASATVAAGSVITQSPGSGTSVAPGTAVHLTVSIQPAQLISPAAGSTLAGATATFQWTAGSGVAEYWLSLGRWPSGSDLYSQSLGTQLSAAVAGLPTDGSTIYVRLWSRIAGDWRANDYTVTATSVGTAAQPAQLISPAAGSTLAGATATFQWTAGSGVAEYWLSLGRWPSGSDLYSQSLGTQLSAAVAGLPTDGSTIYVRLWSRIAGDWRANDYTVTATSVGTAAQPAQLISPAAGSTLAGATATFQWTAGSGVAEYWLSLGRWPSGSDLYSQSLGTQLSAAVAGLPTDGSTIYVRLWSRIAGDWRANDYTVTATSVGTAAQPAQLISPAAGSTLAGATATFQWTAGSGVAEYWLSLGRWPSGSDLYSQSLGTQLSAAVAGLPTDGSTIYVRLWSRIAGDWRANDYTVTATSVGTAAQPAQLISPAAGSTLAGATATFK